MRINVNFLWHNMAAQTEHRFCYFSGQYLEDSDRFCVKRGCKKEIIGWFNQWDKEIKIIKWAYVKEKGNERGVFSKLNFNLVRATVKTLKKVEASKLTIRSFDKCRLHWNKWKSVVEIKRGSRLATKVLKSFGPTEVAHAAVRKHADNDQFFCGSDDYVFWYSDQKIV